MHIYRKFIYPIIIVVLLICNILGQEPDTSIIASDDTVKVSAGKYLYLPNVNSIASKMLLPIYQTPASIGIVSSKTLKDQNANVLSDALKNISGINVQSNLGTQDYFIIRGFESTTSGLILTDGISVPDISMFKIYGFGFYDLYNVDQVEVLKGPASFLYGANTLSGAVNLVRKAPIPRDFAELSLNVGKYNKKRGVFDIGSVKEEGDLLYRCTGLLQYGEQYRKDKYRKTLALNPAATWKINENEVLDINFEYIHNDLIPDAGIPLYIPDENWELPPIEMDMSYQTPMDKSKQEIHRLSVKYEKDMRRAFTVRSKLYFNRLAGSTDLTVPHVPHRNASGIWILERHMYSFNEEQEVLGNQNEALFKFSTGPFEQKLLVGFEASLLKNKSARALSLIPETLYLRHEETVKNYNDIFRLVDIKSNSETFNLAIYLVNHISFSKQFQLLYGGRYDIIDFEVDRRNAPFDFFTMSLSSVPERYSKTFKKFSPMVGIIVHESDNLAFYANWGKSFSQGVRIVDDPILSMQYEAGYKYKSDDGRFRNSLAIYNLEKENIAIPLQRPLLDDLHELSGSQRSQGMEFEISAEPYIDWYLFFTYSFTISDLLKYNALYVNKDIKIKLGDFSNNSAAFIPAHLLNIWSTKKLENGLGLGGGIKYTGKQYVYVDNDFKIDGYFTYDATIFYEINRWRCSINFENITGAKYFTRGFGPYSVIPTQSSEISGTVNFVF